MDILVANTYVCADHGVRSLIIPYRLMCSIDTCHTDKRILTYQIHGIFTNNSV